MPVISKRTPMRLGRWVAIKRWDKSLYKLRHRVENAFLHLKRWRGMATRYAKTTASFLAAVQSQLI